MTLVAPKTEAEAWLVVPALPMVIVILAAVLYGLVALMVMFTGA